MILRTTVLVLPLLIWSCGGGEQADEHDHPHPHPAEDTAAAPATSAEDSSAADAASEQGESDHGERLDLGTIRLGGFAFQVAALGEVAAGAECAFSVEVGEAPDKADPATLNLFLWLEDDAKAQVAAPAKGDLEAGNWHFHVTPRADTSPTRVVLRLRAAGSDERAGLPLSGHGHEHASSVHGGIPAAFHDSAGAVAGHLELKLHDDKGDLELWLARDAALETQFDLPVAAMPTVRFVDVDGRVVNLKVRNTETNEDEDGTPNLRDGKTNYFIYPGDTGEDSTWLMGAEFSSIVAVAFEVNGTRYESEEFVLVPHTHAEGEHDH